MSPHKRERNHQSLRCRGSKACSCRFRYQEKIDLIYFAASKNTLVFNAFDLGCTFVFFGKRMPQEQLSLPVEKNANVLQFVKSLGMIFTDLRKNYLYEKNCVWSYGGFSFRGLLKR